MKPLIAIFCILITLITLPAKADLSSDKPQVVCQYLEKQQLKARSYEKNLDGYFGFAEKTVAEGNPASTLSYNLEGEKPDVVAKVYLMAGVEDKDHSEKVHTALLAASTDLIEKATGQKITEEIIKAINSNTPGEWKLGKQTVKFEHLPSPGGKRYGLMLTID